MKILVKDEGLGRFEWEIPNEISEMIQKVEALAPGTEAIIVEDLREMIRAYLHLVVGAMLFPRSTPALMSLINNGMAGIARESQRVLSGFRP